MNYQKHINKIWKKTAIASKRNLIVNQYIYNKTYLKTKVKSYKGKINTNFHNNKTPKEGSQYITLSVILIDPVYKKR